ncbi:MAG: hypothetical protein AAGF02_15885 [Actinomycetota bacterium]
MDGSAIPAPETPLRHRRTSRATALVLGAVAALAVLSPALRGAPDSYPLSTYPMFSRAADAEVDLSLVIGRTATGERVELSPRLIADTPEVIVAGGTINIAVRRGETDELCERVARRVASSERDEVLTVEVVTDTVDSVAWYEGDRSRTTELLSSCEVLR